MALRTPITMRASFFAILRHSASLREGVKRECIMAHCSPNRARASCSTWRVRAISGTRYRTPKPMDNVASAS